MSKLYINDLSQIANGKITYLNFLEKNKVNSLISLKRVDQIRFETRNVRENLINEFKSDIHKEGININLYPESLFFKDNLWIIIDDINCILSSKLISTNNLDPELESKIRKILPYVRKILELRKYTKILENSFYEDIMLYKDKDKALILNGGGIYLPIGYDELNESEREELLIYYYENYNNILENILIPNDYHLNNLQKDIEKDKVLKLYKGL